MTSDSRWALAELLATVVLPAAALIWLTDLDRLGPVWGLVVALVPPLLWSVVSMVREGQVSALAVIALVSVLLTGGVGLFELDPAWFALKEAAVPLGLGIAVAVTASTRFAMVPVLLDRMFDLDAVRSAAEARGQAAELDAAWVWSTRWMGGIVAASGFVTYALARWLVTSDTGTEAFGDELGRYTLVSLPALLVPSTLGMAVVLQRVLEMLEQATGEEREAFLR